MLRHIAREEVCRGHHLPGCHYRRRHRDVGWCRGALPTQNTRLITVVELIQKRIPSISFDVLHERQDEVIHGDPLNLMPNNNRFDPMFFPMGRPVVSAGGALWPVIKSANSETREILLFAVKEHGFLGLGASPHFASQDLWESFCTFHHFHPNGSSAIL